MDSNVRALRGEAVTFKADPFLTSSEDALVYVEDALVLIKDGKIIEFGDFTTLKQKIPQGVPVTHYENALISAGFIDGHVHYPQIQMINAYGDHLIDWLNNYTFPAEQEFVNKAHATEVADTFLNELLRAGTTTACVYCTTYPQSVDAFFEQSTRRNTRMIAGKMMMDRNAPAALLDTPKSAYDDSLALFNRWHGKGRQHYAVTPRFAPTSTEEQLEVAGQLFQEKAADGIYLQTHLEEQVPEVEWVMQLFPKRKNYLDVYDHANLVGKRSVFGHVIHTSESEWSILHEKGAGVCHCPTSNLFLGSGLFKAFSAKDPKRPVRVGLGTDLGAGTSFSQLQTLGEAYKVAQLNNTALDAAHALYLATRGGAELLYLEDKVGTLAKGMEADITVLDLHSTPFMKWRMERSKTFEERLFILLCMGDTASVRATYVYGELLYDKARADTPFSFPG
ncbi:guanine deaminase [Pseudomonas sp.]|uniref:guanine deaminase n=1 Tax=Pseudomonas sp. TaxID=306 RepID=UPI002613E39A|nr:guanine deaminase [Pseudomonas sp.]